MVKQYVKSIKSKRYSQTYNRFKKIRARHLDLADEAAELEACEIRDKNLLREHYINEDEPQEWVGL